MMYFQPDPKLFREEEFVDRETFKFYKARGWDVWRLFDADLLYSVEMMRKELKVPFVINNWHNGGNREWSGFRTPRSPYFSQYSQHNGKAVDIITPKGPTPEEIRKMMIKDPMKECWKYITALEMTQSGKVLTWLHMDTRNHNKEKLGFLQMHV